MTGSGVAGAVTEASPFPGEPPVTAAVAREHNLNEQEYGRILEMLGRTHQQRRARQLGLRHTHYANAIGLDDPGNYSSAEDLVKLTLILRRNEFFRQVTDLPRATLKSGAHSRTILNRNLLVRSVTAARATRARSGDPRTTQTRAQHSLRMDGPC